MSIAAAAGTDDRLKALKALRDRLAGEIDNCASMRDLASLSQRLMDTLAQIDELGGSKKAEPPKTGLTRFEAKLAERQATASGSRRS